MKMNKILFLYHFIKLLLDMLLNIAKKNNLKNPKNVRV